MLRWGRPSSKRTESGGPEEALRFMQDRDRPVDLLITDIVMPKMSGLELAEQLQVARPAMKILYMSGYSDDAIARHGPLPPSVSFLEKPFTLQALQVRVRDILTTGHTTR
jgi:two-component system cell cycle sensor histidine kinase/response regulator CckA